MSTDRPENRRKRLKLLLILGGTSSALAMGAAIFAWAWGPGGTHWVLPPQAIVEEGPQKVDKRWAALQMPQMPVATISGPMTTNKPEIEAESDEIAVTAELGSTFAPTQQSTGPSELPPANYQSFASLGSPNLGGGTGRSWRGTFHPNGSGPGSLSFPNYSSGGVGSGFGGSGPGTPPVPGICEGPDASNKPECQCEGPDAGKKPECQTGRTQNPDLDDGDDQNGDGGDGGDGGTGGSCVTTTSVVDGQTVVTKSGDCDEETNTGNNGNNGGNGGTGGNNGQGGTGGSCVTTTSVVNGQTVVIKSGNCDQQNAGNDDDQQNGGNDDDPPPPYPPVGGPICLSEEGCDTGGPGGNDPIVAIAEPGSLALLLSGLAGLLALRRRR